MCLDDNEDNSDKRQELENKLASVKARNEASHNQFKPQPKAKSKSTKQRQRNLKAVERAAEHNDRLKVRAAGSESRKKRRDNSKSVWE